VDLHEEIARLAGYARIPSTIPVAPIAAASSESTQRFQRVHALRHRCAGLGLSEVITWALVSEQDLVRAAIPVAEAARLANPLSQDHAFLRPSLRVSLLDAVRHNLSQDAPGVPIFEVARVISPQGAPRESWRLGMALCGHWTQDWQGTVPSDFFRLKGLLDAVAVWAQNGPLHFRSVDAAWGEPGQASEVVLHGRVIGSLGQVRRTLTEAWNIKTDVWVAEVEVEPLLEQASAPPLKTPPSFPAVKRDLSILVGRDVPCSTIDAAIREAAGPLAERINLIDRYTGRQVAEGKVSYTFSIQYRDPTRTLTAQEADAAHQRVVQRLAEGCHATLR
jgi:phenylalanyl-tRNA synthetase beta chain